MSKTYTITEAIYYLRVDPKTFQKWLTKAGIDLSEQVSRADSRVRYLTSEQLAQLAEDHARVLDLSHPVPIEKPTAQQGQIKLLDDRLKAQEQLVSEHGGQLKAHTEMSITMNKTLDEIKVHMLHQDDSLTFLNSSTVDLAKNMQSGIDLLAKRALEQEESLNAARESQLELSTVQEQYLQENERLTRQLADIQEQRAQEHEQLTQQLAQMNEQLVVLVAEVERLKEKPKRVRRPKASKAAAQTSIEDSLESPSDVMP